MKSRDDISDVKLLKSLIESNLVIIFVFKVKNVDLKILSFSCIQSHLQKQKI